MSDTPNSTPTPTMDAYLNATVAPRFAELVQAATQRANAAQRELDDLRAASGTIAWEISGPASEVCYANIADGAITVAAEPAHAPFLTIVQTPADWERFTHGLAHLFTGDPRRPFGRSRIERVRAITGAVRFLLTGVPDGGEWACTLYFGAAARPAEPQTTVTLPADLVTKMQSGQLDPQMAFMQGQIKLSGDMSLAMQLGMALFM